MSDMEDSKMGNHRDYRERRGGHGSRSGSPPRVKRERDRDLSGSPRRRSPGRGAIRQHRRPLDSPPPRSRSRSPRRYRDRPRSRSFSPPQRYERDRDGGRGGGGGGGRRDRGGRDHFRSRSRSPEKRRQGGGGGGGGNNRNMENPEPSRCLGVFGMGMYTTETELQHVFNKYGPIERVQVVKDAKTGRSRGFAFVYYENMEDAKIAKDQCSGMEIDGRRIRVDFSVTQRPHTPTPGIYMGRPTYSHGRRRSPSPAHRSRRAGGYDRSRSRSYSPRRY